MRSVPEWKGKTPDTKIPPRVMDRVSEKQGNRCLHCTREFSRKLPAQGDHKVALILGGENRENNVQALCLECHKLKTKAEVKVKSKIAKARQERKGIKRKSRWPNSRDGKWKSRMDGTTVPRVIPKCEECGKYLADWPSTICVGCHAYKEHTA